MPQLADCLNGSGPVLNQYGDIGNALAPSLGTLNENDNPLKEKNRHIFAEYRIFSDKVRLNIFATRMILKAIISTITISEKKRIKKPGQSNPGYP
ncbi:MULTISPECIES: hypothetical protein [Serratia]|uniref:hypothetical protein n=1 Tax=Serratia TaxID=613 RepID=UPI0021AD72B0|nr:MULTISPECIES: hypothetical protein [Serratia]MDM1776655.1 hypothetical protein [Serratia marcescens]